MFQKGHKKSKNASSFQKGNKVCVGRVPWNKGLKGVQKQTEETKIKRGIYKTGESAYGWKGDDRKLIVNKSSDYRYKQWAKNVKSRDGCKCIINDGNCNGRLEAHHILPWRSYPDLRYVIKNGVTVCHFHHPQGEINEKKFTPLFQDLVSQKKKKKK